MTTPAPAEPGVSVTLYKAVTATVSWEQVRTAAKAMGMRLTELEGAEDIEAWVHPSGRRIYIGGDADDMGHEIETLARIAGTSPGEMLERIVGPTPSYPGAVPWRSRAHVSTVIQALVYRDATDTQAADFLAAHVEDIRAYYMRRLTLEPVPMKFVSPTAQKAAEDMRDRCAAVVDDIGGQVAEFSANVCANASAAIRALPLTAEPAGAWVSDETRHPGAAAIIRDAAKAWRRLADGITRVHVAVDVPVETPSVEEPDAGPYDDRCRWVLGNCGARCRYVFDHHKRGVPCAARTSAAPPVADASAELRARLVAELHAAGYPGFADYVASSPRDPRDIVAQTIADVRRMLSADLRRDLGIEVPK